MQTVYLIDDDESLKKKLNEIFRQDKSFKFKQIKTENVDLALKDIPALIINDNVISEGKVLSAKEIVKVIKTEAVC